MSVLSWVIGPVKAGCQLITGDTDGASKTARTMVMSTPWLGHTVGIVSKVVYDDDELLEEANRHLGSMVNAMPGVGHVKGVVHYVCGDVEGGNEAMLSATRSTTVMAAGAGGFFIGGPVGAVVAGAESGAVWDDVVKRATNGEKTPGVDQIAEDPEDPLNCVDEGENLAKFSQEEQLSAQK